MADLKVAVAGAGGRMGLANIKAVAATDGVTLHAAFDRPGAQSIGQDAGLLAAAGELGVAVTQSADEALEGADAVIDFTVPAATVELAGKAAQHGLVHVIGTTGCSADDEAALSRAADEGARIVKAGNMSLGVNLLVALVRQAARALGPDWDAEILEMHHNRKVDAPSGTALMLGEAVAAGHGVALADKSVMAREGHVGAREKGEIGFATLRGGNVIGEHRVFLVGPNERIEMSHVAQDRALFADGAIKAVKWAADRPAGYYSMAEVLGLETRG